MLTYALRVLICCLFLCCIPGQLLLAGNAAVSTPTSQNSNQLQPIGRNGKIEEAAASGERIFSGFRSTLSSELKTPVDKTPEEKLAMLNALLKQGKSLRQDASQVERSLQHSSATTDTSELEAQLKSLAQQLNETTTDFERIATGVELSTFDPPQEKQFNWQEELSALLDPIIKELQAVTATTKQRADLKESTAILTKQADAAAQAVHNLEGLIQVSPDKDMTRQLNELLDTWKNEQERIKGKLELAQMKLQSLTTQDGPILERTTKRLSSFLKTRGLYLLLAVLAFSATLLLLRYLSRLLLRHLPTDKHGRPPMYARLITVFSHFVSLIFALVALIAVFYIVADWFMLSLVILFILGLLWAVRQTLPRQWKQSILMLNMGAVREGERLLLDGVPWRVDSLGMYCRLSNPTLGQIRRMPIENILEEVSRPYDLDEPWFPCKKGDYIKLDGNNVVQVISLSHEQVEVMRAGLSIIYPTATFLDLAAGNMSQKFTVSATLGLSYDLQAEITERIPQTLRSYLQNRLDEEGYSSKCLGITCEFSLANSSSLDILAVLEFQGDMASLYYRLNRSLQRWCVECCTENQWEIPFNQLTVHTG